MYVLLYYVYCIRCTRILKCHLSISFALNNGVKQAGVLSPILFTLYINGLLEILKSSGLGCHIGRMFAGAFGYADDIAIATPSIILYAPNDFNL